MRPIQFDRQKYRQAHYKPNISRPKKKKSSSREDIYFSVFWKNTGKFDVFYCFAQIFSNKNKKSRFDARSIVSFAGNTRNEDLSIGFILAHFSCFCNFNFKCGQDGNRTRKRKMISLHSAPVSLPGTQISRAFDSYQKRSIFLNFLLLLDENSTTVCDIISKLMIISTHSPQPLSL